MIFISVLLVVWFVLWLMSAIHTKDVLQLFVAWMEAFDGDKDDGADTLIEKSEDREVYHLNCSHCNHLWRSVEPNVNYCPNCGKKWNM